MPRGPRQASSRTLAIAAGAVALVVVAVVLAVVLTRGGTASAVPKNTPTIGRIDQNSLPGARQVQSLFKGIPQHGLVLGSAFAPAQLVEYVDLQCPVCQAFETSILPSLVEKYVKPGKLKIVMKPGAIIGPDSVRGQQATIAASLQNRAFNFAEMLYLNQQTENTGWLNDSMVAQAAASVPGMHVPTLFDQLSSPATKSTARAVDAKLGGPGAPYDATPTILLSPSSKTPKVVSIGLPKLSTLESQIDQAIAG
jgi:protein-disulfide isomerase